MTTILILIGVIILAGLIYLASLDGSYEVRRSLLMDVDAQTVFDKVRDFKTWKDWSPWLLHEPETSLTFSENYTQEGGSYSWDGKRVGAGKLTHKKFAAPQRIDEEIEFIRPFKSVCKVWWEFVEQNGQTEVSWCMQGRMPFLLRFMTIMTSSMIAKDYALGLAMLRGQLDKTAERPVIDFQGTTERDAQSALVIPFAGELAEMVKVRQEGFPKLTDHVESSHGTPTGPPFTAYHEVNLQKMFFRCDLALPVSADADKGEFQYKDFAGGKYFKVTLQGSYEFLELAWYSAMSHLRMIKLKRDKSRPSYEVYENDPRAVVSTNEILTTLYMPIR